ncbi:MAG: gliding motility lipoprotein GldH [Bacteroidota bacterium]
MLLCLPCLLLMSCGPDYLFQEKIELPNQEWTYENIAEFKVEVTDTMALYHLYLDIEHSVHYPHQNIYVKIHTLFPSGEKLSKQIPIDFADKGGQWYGKCSGEWCRLRVVIQEGAFFNAVGTHVFSFEQYLRMSPLPGMKSLAFGVEQTGLKRE